MVHAGVAPLPEERGITMTTSIRSGIRRARLYVRECGGAEGTWRSARPSGGTAYALVGVAEIDRSAGWAREAIHDVGTLFGASGGTLSFEGAPRPLEAFASTCDLPFLATSTEFRNTGDVHRALGYGGGGMILRDTRARSPEGTGLVLVLMCLNLHKGSLPDAHMVSMTIESRSGDPKRPGMGRLVVEGECPLPGRGHGQSLCQIAKEPIWGWGAEPHGFTSLMRLEAIDAATRLQDMILRNDPDQEEMLRLQRFTGGAVQMRGKDRIYDAFRDRMHREGMTHPWDHTPTASEVVTRGRAAEALVRTLLEDAA